MRYFAGIDGGASKTLCLIGDEAGRILSQGRGGPANYQIVGEQAAKVSIQQALSSALAEAGVALGALEFVVLGLAGADLEEDFDVLKRIVAEVLGQVPFKVMNDCWIGLKSCLSEGWGVVSICGTGANAAGRSLDGREVIFRGMSYELGNRGGGTDLIKDALHAAFRSEEQTGRQTLLQREIPKLFGKKTMADLVNVVRGQNMAPEIIYALPFLVYDLANQGDEVAQTLLLQMGRTLGEMAGGIVRQLGMTQLEVPIFLVGGLWKGKNPLLKDEYVTTVHRSAPLAKIAVSEREPAYGAFLLARESAE